MTSMDATGDGRPSVAAIAVEAADGHRFELLACIPDRPERSLLWMPALGTAARHYLPLAHALAQRGVAVFLHEWRGHGSSSVRAGRDSDWGYRALLAVDLPASEAAVAATAPGLARIAGGHSLGGQLAACRLGLAPAACEALWLAGCGAPWWRAFPPRERVWLPVAYRVLPWLAERAGSLPGRRIGFGGNEARGVMRDWSGTALSGRYTAAGLADLESGMADARVQLRAVLFEHDWLAPASSLQHLLSKLPGARAETTVLDSGALRARADHFQWMKSPQPVADWLDA
jgi:predicted alpha/beta hydrolase